MSPFRALKDPIRILFYLLILKSLSVSISHFFLNENKYFFKIFKGLTLCEGDGVSVDSDDIKSVPAWPSTAHCKVAQIFS